MKSNRTTGNDNTTYIQTTERIDHFFNESALNDGKHKQVHLPVLAAAPSTVAGEVAIYTKNTASGSNLFMIRDGNAATATQLSPAVIAKPASTTNGYTFLPGDGAVGCLLLQWGTVNTPGSSGTVTFPTPFKAATVPFSIQVTAQRDSGGRACTVDSGTIPTNTAFKYLMETSGSDKLYWMAIGLAGA